MIESILTQRNVKTKTKRFCICNMQFEEDEYKATLSAMRKAQEDRIQMDLSQGLKVSLVYLNLLQETQELLSGLRHYLRAYRRFQQ